MRQEAEHSMATELLRVQTGSGKLRVTEASIELESPGFPAPKTRTIMRTAIVGVDHKVSIRPAFGMGGAMHFTIHLQGGERLEIKSVPFKAGEQLISILL